MFGFHYEPEPDKVIAPSTTSEVFMYRHLLFAATFLLPCAALADNGPEPQPETESAECEYVAQQQTCLSHSDCAPGSGCINPGVCVPGVLAQQMTFADLPAANYFTYTDGSCNYDTDCGPWACVSGWCTTPETAGRPVYPRANYAYYDTSCGGPQDCGALSCIQGWCRSPQFASTFNGSGGGPTNNGTGMTAYNGTGYQLSCPSSWALSPPDGTTDLMCLDQVQDGFFENCNVVFENTGVPYDAFSYWSASRTMMQGVMAGFSVNSERPITIGGRQGYRVDYNHAMFQTPMRVLAYFVTNNTTGYVLTCTAGHQSFVSFEPTFDSIANSMVIY